MVFINADTFVKNFRIYLGNKIYFAEQLSFDIHAGLSSNTEDLNTGGIFNYAFRSAARTVQFSIKDGLNYKKNSYRYRTNIKYVNLTWNTSQASYDNRSPKSINYLLSNYVPTSPLSASTSSYLNLVPFRAVYINSPDLTDHHYKSPASYSSSIIKNSFGRFTVGRNHK